MANFIGTPRSLEANASAGSIRGRIGAKWSISTKELAAIPAAPHRPPKSFNSQQQGPPSGGFSFAVPELTRSAGIQLNGRVSLRCIPHALSIVAPDIAQRPGHTPGKAVRRSYSAWRLCFLEAHEVIMVWFFMFPIICAAVAIFMWRFERHLDELTGPWISD